MPSFESLLTFFGIVTLMALSPGPDNIFVLVQSIQRGWKAGMAVVLGLCCGVVGHTIAVAFGLAAVVAASTHAFTVIKLCGAAYLLWLAWGAWHAPALLEVPSSNGEKNKPDVIKPAQPSFFTMMGRGVIMNLTNPKVLIFFLAFLPQFADPKAELAVQWQIMIYGAVFILVTLLVFGAIACFSGLFGEILRKSAFAQKVLNRFASLVFVGLAIRLATLRS